MAADRYGLELQGSEADVEAYESLLEGYLWFEPDMVDRIATVERQGAGAPPMARILRGQLMAMSHTAAGTALAVDTAASLERVRLLPREELHRHALAAVGRGDVDGATSAWGQILDDWPTDVMALRLQHFALFNRGDITEMLRRAVTARQQWAQHGDLPGRSLLDGMACFAYEEAGSYAEGEPLGRAAVEADEDDLWSIHAVAHVLEMTGRHHEGVAWIAERAEILGRHGSFAGHIWWHQALYLLEAGRHDEALELYDQRVSDPGAVEGLTLTNCIALLCRLEWMGVDVGDRWLPLVDGASLRTGHHTHPFNDCHYAYALERAGRTDLAEGLHDAATAWTRQRHDTASSVFDAAALDVVAGMRSLAAGDPAAAADALARSRADRWRIGGSHAQRDVFEQAQIVALSRSGDREAALQLVEHRLIARPDSPREHMLLSSLSVGDEAVRALDDARRLGWAA